MKKTALLFLALFQGICFYGQTSLQQFSLEYGPHQVGYKNYKLEDNSRVYQRKMDWSNEYIARPISISIWYPAKETSSSQKLRILDYMRVYKHEKEWDHLPDEEILNWFVYYNTPQNQNHLKERSQAFHQPKMQNGRFPSIIYAPSYEASSIENFALCEYLASHGYIVIASPSLGPNSQWIGKETVQGIESQARDLEFLLAHLLKTPNVDPDKIATMGFSFGSLSNVLLQMRHKKIKALVSLDGTIRYNYQALKKIPGTDIKNVDVPFIHMAQKKIPDSIVKKDKIDPKLNYEFTFYDELLYSDAYKLRFHDLTHFNFSSLDILFRNRDKRQDKSDAKIMSSYKLVANYSLQFLNAYLKDNSNSITFLRESKNPLLSKEYKIAREKSFDFRSFHDIAKQQNYENLITLYTNIKKKNPDFSIKEWYLNQLGLQLVYNPKTYKSGIAVFHLAIHLFPKSANLYDSLASGYQYNGDVKNAIKNYKKSLELNPQNQHAIQKLKELQ